MRYSNLIIVNVFVQFIIHQRFIQLHEIDIKNIRFVKYIKNHLLNYYNNLYEKIEFANQNIVFYSKKTKFKSLKRKKIEINVNENLNVVVDAYNDYKFFKKNVFMKKKFDC